jgi:hypothetical protein
MPRTLVPEGYAWATAALVALVASVLDGQSTPS